MTTRAVGIAVNHGYAVTPDVPEYSGFFDLLRTEGRRAQPLDALDDARLRHVDALLIGAPRWMFNEPAVLATRAWVREGGALLVLATMGGDSPADGSRGGYTGLSRLCPGVTLDAVALGTLHDKGVDRDGYPYFELDRAIALDASRALGEGATVRYVAGCSLTPAPGLDVTHEWPVSQGFYAVPSPLEDDGEFYSWSDDPPQPARGAALLRYRYGAGTITVFGAARSFSNAHLGEASNADALSWIFARWLPNLAHDEVFARKRRPQRHRLLHGYPMQPLMPAIAPDAREAIERREFAPLAPDRGLIVGVLPHPFCNPRVRGCGFCTFPHEVYGNASAREVAGVVAGEIDAWRARADREGFTARKVHALYLGGATANLTPPDAMRRVVDALSHAFDLSGAEVTLEGVPIHFAPRGIPTAHEVVAQHLGARHQRWSLGVQTFDRAQLERMGRTAFGDEACITNVVKFAHATGRTASCDLLFNLPGQSLAAMCDDVDRAVAIGFDHVCLYHLVLFEGLGTEWSMDKSLLAALPDNRAACARWVTLRERLIDHGFVQTSLTNFERRAVHERDARFCYESAAYRPERFDLVGFGPTAISLRYDPDLRGAVKLLNPDDSVTYTAAARAKNPRIKAFQYDARDARILFLTRRAVTLGWSIEDYRTRFGESPLAEFPLEFEALTRDRLVAVNGDAVSLTPKGMFYADTVAAMFAWRRVNQRRYALPRGGSGGDRVRVYDPNNSNFNPMG